MPFFEERRMKIVTSSARFAVIAALPIVFFVIGCATSEPTTVAATARTKRRTRAEVAAEKPAMTDSQELVVEGVQTLIGAESLVVRGREFAMDCSGFVRAAYYYAGIDLSQDFDKYTGNGVTRIYRTLKDRNLIHETELPNPGDIVFWDNTYDKNEDGLWNDELTHVGIILSSDTNGDIEYVHCNYRKGIIIEHMNLLDAETWTKELGGKTVILNSPMRMRGQVVNDRWLSSHLFRSFSSAYELE